MHLEFKAQGYEDMTHWAETNPARARLILGIIERLLRDPGGGWPQPEPLKNELAGWFSKPIEGKHRLVYRVDGDRIVVAQARCHF